MAKFDIISLFPSIDISEVTLTISNSIDKLDHLSQKNQNIFEGSVKWFIQSRVFYFNSKYYKQDKGAPMRSHISSILAESNLRPLEEIIFDTLKIKLRLSLR